MKKEKSIYPQVDPVEKLIEIGSYLRQAREERSISLEEIAAKTRIQVRLLRAIEEGKLDFLPEPIYIRGFIKQFAEALGLNGKELASSFPTWQSRVIFKPYWLHISPGQLRPIHLYLLYVFLVIGAVNGLSRIVNQSATRANEQNNAQQQTEGFMVQAQRESADSMQMAEPVTFDRTNNAEKPVRVGVTLRSPSWIRIVADGKTEFEGVLTQGEQRTWMAKEQLTVMAGNAGGVLVAFNNQKAKEMGEPGKAEKLTFQAHNPVNQ